MGYYQPLVKPQVCGKHYFWSNFYIPPKDFGSRGQPRRGGNDIASISKVKGFDLSGYDIPNKRTVLRNCVKSALGLHIFNSAFKVKQMTLTNGNAQETSL